MRDERSRSGGFTLLELMVGIAVLAVTLGIAIPSYADMMRRNRVTTHTNQLVAAFAVARSEAVKRGAPIAVCSSDATQSECAESEDWSNGWIACTDEGAVAGLCESGETIVQRWSAPAEDQVRIVTTAVEFVRYRADGRTQQPGGTSAVFIVRPTRCHVGDARSVTVTATGRAASTPTACP